MAERSYRALLWTLALTGLCLDQASKYGVFAWKLQAADYTYPVFRTSDGRGFKLIAQADTDESTGLPKVVNGLRVPHVNQGALFGLGREHGWLANLVFALVSLLAGAAILYWSTQKGTAADRWLCAALGLILAGTLGNLYDRVVFHGVRDFLHWNYLFDWPVFNVADCCLVCGAGLLLLQAFGPQARREGAAEPAAPAHADLATASKG